MSSITDLIYFLSYIFGFVTLIIFIISKEVKHKLLMCIPFSITLVMGYFYNKSIITFIGDNYKNNSVVYFLFIILILFVFWVSICVVNKENDYGNIHKSYSKFHKKNKELNNNESNINNKNKNYILNKCKLLMHKLYTLRITNFINKCILIVISYVMSIIILSTFGLHYLYLSNSNNIAECLESISISCLSLIPLFLIYIFCRCLIYNHSSIKCFFNELYNKHLKKASDIILCIILICTCVSFVLYQKYALSSSLSNKIFYSKLLSKCCINNKYKLDNKIEYPSDKCSKKNLSLRNHNYILEDKIAHGKKHVKLVYKYNVYEDNLIYNLKDKKIRKILGNKHQIKFHLYKFTNNHYYFKYKYNCVNKTPVNVQLILIYK